MLGRALEGSRERLSSSIVRGPGRPVRVTGTDDATRIPGKLESAFLFSHRGGERHLAIESTNNKAPRIRVNRQIRISPIRVIAPDGAQLGVLTVE